MSKIGYRTESEQKECKEAAYKMLGVKYNKLKAENKKLREANGHYLEVCRENQVLEERIKELEAELEQHRWIPVSEKLPELRKMDEGAMMSSWVRITDGKEIVDAYYYDFTKREAKPNYVTGKGWYCHGMKKSDITHWKPIILP